MVSLLKLLLNSSHMASAFSARSPSPANTNHDPHRSVPEPRRTSVVSSLAVSCWQGHGCRSEETMHEKQGTHSQGDYCCAACKPHASRMKGSLQTPIEWLRLNDSNIVSETVQMRGRVPQQGREMLGNNREPPASMHLQSYMLTPVRRECGVNCSKVAGQARARCGWLCSTMHIIIYMHIIIHAACTDLPALCRLPPHTIALPLHVLITLGKRFRNAWCYSDDGDAGGCRIGCSVLCHSVTLKRRYEHQACTHSTQDTGER